MGSIIYILWQRQLKRYFRSKGRVVGSLAQPVLFLVALGFGLGPIFQQATGDSYIQFLAPGIIAMSILFTSIFLGIDLIWDKQFGFLKETLVGPVPRSVIMLGRSLGVATVGFMQGLLVFFLSWVIGFQPEVTALFPLAFLFMILIALFFTALGTSIASQLEDMSSFPLVMNFLVMPIFFLSGALFPLDNLPSSILWFSYINPLSYGVDGLRKVLTGTAYFGLGIDVAVMVVSIVVVLAVGTQLFRRIQI